MRDLLIEATNPDISYEVIWRGTSLEVALKLMTDSSDVRRLELWSPGHAGGPKGFCPMAYREENSTRISISNTLRLIAGL